MILHLDMDAFFASIEQMDNPDLRGKPVIVGHDARGVVTTASYEARVYGIHSAMPMATARRLCPHGVFVPPRGKRYSEVSARAMACLATFSPAMQKASIDEAYLDLSDSEKLNGGPRQAAESIQRSIAEATGGLTCSIGIAPVKFLAKICSDINKPNGLFILDQANVDSFLLSLDVGKLPGVGKSMAASLASFGITRVTQLRRLSREFLRDRYGKFGEALYDRARGIDPRIIAGNPPQKSESSEHTFSRDIFDRKILEQILAERADEVGSSLRRYGRAGRTITLKIKFADFRQITRSRTLETRVNSTKIIFAAARELLAKTPLRQPVRLLGVCVSGFEPRPEHLRLPGLEAMDEKSRCLDEAMDSLRARFGHGIIRRGENQEGG